MQDGAAVTGLLIAGASLVAVNTTGNAIYDPIGSIIVGNLLGMVIYMLLSLAFSSYSCTLKSLKYFEVIFVSFWQLTENLTQKVTPPYIEHYIIL